MPALIAALGPHGAHAGALEAILVGGAQMFATGSGMEIGARNEAAVRAALVAGRHSHHGDCDRRSMGRTVRVHVATGNVTVREAGSKEVDLR